MEDSAGCLLSQHLGFHVQKRAVSSASQLKPLFRVGDVREVQSVIQSMVDTFVNAHALTMLDTLSCDSSPSGGEHSAPCRHESFVHCTTRLLKRFHGTFRNG